ncbi:hypothetical protein TgHK011_006285 [Trichoderma gracile]|nr:hypothetical protein TgHK011_006285 [Trichoderma gracile]
MLPSLPSTRQTALQATRKKPHESLKLNWTRLRTGPKPFRRDEGVRTATSVGAASRQSAEKCPYQQELCWASALTPEPS